MELLPIRTAWTSHKGKVQPDKAGTPRASAIGGSAFRREGATGPTTTPAMTEIDTLCLP
jgi:hypothetical protein